MIHAYFSVEGRDKNGERFSSEVCSIDTESFRKILHESLDEYMDKLQNQNDFDVKQGDLKFLVVPCCIHRE